jgi:hypothetical protein
MKLSHAHEGDKQMHRTTTGIQVALIACIFGLVGLLAGCGGAGGSSPPDWFYHWNCNGDSECLATNPTGAASGTLNEGPEETDCTELLTFGEHFWNIPPATQSCDHDAGGDGGGSVTISAFSPSTAAPGTNVTIDGSGFPSGVTVTVDGLTCTIVSATSTEIVITLPGMGNFVGPIVVDGISSTADLTVVNHFFGVASSSTQSVAVGGNTTLSGSTDGSTWRTVDLGSATFLSAIAWSGTNTLATVGEAGAVYTNTTGSASWLLRTSGTSHDLFGVASSGTLFAAVGRSGTIITSPDGITWTHRTSHTTDTLAGVAWCTTQFVAVGNDGVIDTSPDGVTWTLRTSGTTGFLNGVGCSGAMIVAGEGDTTSGGAILSSPDGVTWTQRAVASTDAVYGIASSGTLFVASGFGGTIYTSPDGITWTQRNSGSTQSLNAASWSSARSQFVVVGGYGTLLTSSDGMTWTSHTP